MTIETDIDPTAEHAAHAFIAKMAARFDLSSAILFGGSCVDAP